MFLSPENQDCVFCVLCYVAVVLYARTYWLCPRGAFARQSCDVSLSNSCIAVVVVVNATAVQPLPTNNYACTLQFVHRMLLSHTSVPIERWPTDETIKSNSASKHIYLFPFHLAAIRDLHSCQKKMCVFMSRKSSSASIAGTIRNPKNKNHTQIHHTVKKNKNKNMKYYWELEAPFIRRLAWAIDN